MGRRSTILLVGMFLAAMAASAQESSRKAAVPGEAARVEAGRLVKEVYGDAYAQAKTVELKAALARKLIAKSSESQADPAGRYVLLAAARDLATQAGDAATAFQAVDEIAGVFDVDAIAMKTSVLTQGSTMARLPPHYQFLVKSALGVLDQALAVDDFTSAGQLLAVALKAAPKAQERTLLPQVQARAKEVEELGAAFRQAQAAEAVLARNPDDVVANLALGKYLCLDKGQWEKGLRNLALGNDASLKALAAKDLAVASTATEQAALGDAWWDYAEKLEGAPQDRVRGRARQWYERALPGLSGGLLAEKVKKRLAVGARHETEPATASVSGIVILQAAFGVPGKQADVATLVQKAVAQETFAVIQADDRAFGDPAPGQQKRLTVQGRCGTARFTFDLSQQEVAPLPPIPPQGVRLSHASKAFAILAARYGAGLTWFDVTESVADRVTSPDKPILWGDYKVSQDPWFGVAKHVVIWFDYDGTRYVRVLTEGETQRLLPPPAK